MALAFVRKKRVDANPWGQVRLFLNGLYRRHPPSISLRYCRASSHDDLLNELFETVERLMFIGWRHTSTDVDFDEVFRVSCECSVMHKRRQPHLLPRGPLAWLAGVLHRKTNIDRFQ